jgi:acyl-CoA dehydrogenase
MDIDFPEELRMLQDTIRKFVDRELIPLELTSMDGHDLRPDIRAKLEAKAKELGLWLLDVPAEYGGRGLGTLEMAVIWEEMARTIAIPPRGPRIFGPEVRPTLYSLNEEQKARYLLPLLRGEKRTAFAQTEPDAGSDPRMIRTTARRQGQHFLINGTKRFISHAEQADFFQVVARADAADGKRPALSMFLVDAGTPGLTISKAMPTMMGDVTYELAFDDVLIPANNLMGEEGQGMRLAQKWLTSGRLMQACRGLGVAQRCIELAARYSQQRVTFGAPLSDRQAVQFMISDLFLEHQLAQCFVYKAAVKADQGRLEVHESYIAKISCTELAFKAADRCMQIFGGMGLSLETPIHKFWKDSRGFMITEGSVEVMRMALSRSVLQMYA